MWRVIYIMIFPQGADVSVSFILSLCYLLWLLLLSQEALKHCNLQRESSGNFSVEIKSGENTKESSPSPNRLWQSSWVDTTFTNCWAVRACRVENVLLMSFTVTFCACAAIACIFRIKRKFAFLKECEWYLMYLFSISLSFHVFYFLNSFFKNVFKWLCILKFF